MSGQACVETMTCTQCRIGFDDDGEPIYPLLLLRGRFWCCPECGCSYGANPHPVLAKAGAIIRQHEELVASLTGRRKQ